MTTRKLTTFAAMPPVHRAIYDDLCEVARRGDPCPQNAVLSERYGPPGCMPDYASYIINALVSGGFITRSGRGGHRVIGITHTKDFTAPSERVGGATSPCPAPAPVDIGAPARFEARMRELGRRFEDDATEAARLPAFVNLRPPQELSRDAAVSWGRK